MLEAVVVNQHVTFSDVQYVMLFYYLLHIVLPEFEAIDCPEGGKAEYCLEVKGIGMIEVEVVSETVFVGTLTAVGVDEPIPVVVIHNPEEDSALVCIFEIDCLRTGYYEICYPCAIILIFLCIVV